MGGMAIPEGPASPPPPLDRDQLPEDPIVLFRGWFDEAMASNLEEPTATALATVGPDGAPSVRMVLLKGLDDEGFVFYTHFESRKGRELALRPEAALALWWPPLGRQVRVEGHVRRVSDDDADAYFRSRPAASRWSAIASPQSRVIESRAELEERVRRARAAGPDDPPRPHEWGGFRLAPERIEFWQQGRDRLHDRFLYTRLETGGWRIERLAP